MIFYLKNVFFFFVFFESPLLVVYKISPFLSTTHLTCAWKISYIATISYFFTEDCNAETKQKVVSPCSILHLKNTEKETH